ncbi:MAG TPA: DUF4230 domain-containing protein [Candidatus Binatia bacterium]|nr:DUF4230 domain-containing protein [Candidatus Binatia bacterium]
MNKILSVFIGLSLLALTVGLVIYLNTVRPVEKGAAAAGKFVSQSVDKAAELGKHGIDRAADAFKAIFQSQVNITASSTVCDATPIAELAVLRRNIREIVDYSRTDLGSNKRIIAEQTFVAKIGFDLAAKFSATYDVSNHVITVLLPEPKVLSLESSNPAPRYYLVESGVINKIATDDYQQILMQLKEQARHSADAALAIGDAKRMIETRFQDLFQPFNVKVVVLFSSDHPMLHNQPAVDAGNSRK